MGAGKTRVGERLARALKARFEDLDRRIEDEAGASIADLFETSGEQAFRRLETAVLKRLALAPGNCVIATGGGTATKPENVETMRETGLVLWLDPPFDEISSRLDRGARADRPLFGSEQEAKALFATRRPVYAAAGRRIEVAAGEGPAEVAERVYGELSALGWRPAPGARSR